MNGLFRLWKKLKRNKRYRESFPSAVVKRMLPLQIRVLRKQRGWSQAQLAEASGLTQGVVSRAEDANYGNLTINTLVRIAAGFDCAFVGRFAPFSDLGKWYVGVSEEKALEVPSFPEDQGFTDVLKPAAAVGATWKVLRDYESLIPPRWVEYPRCGMSVQSMPADANTVQVDTMNTPAAAIITAFNYRQILGEDRRTAFQGVPLTSVDKTQYAQPVLAEAH